MSKYKGKIGVIDSGYGGVSILKEIIKELPEYDYVYLGDNARAPYGVKSFEVVLEHTWECVEFLIKKKCKLIILACNTASAKALRTIQQERLKDYPGVRVLGVIRPSTEIAGKLTQNSEIGILATPGTVNSNSYQIEINKFFPELTVNQMACPLWVPLIENAEHQSMEGKDLIKKDLDNFIDKFPKTEAVILGCTHYPILKDVLSELYPAINFIAQGQIVAHALKEYLTRHEWLVRKLSTKQQLDFLTTESKEVFNKNVKTMFNIDVKSKTVSI